MNAQLRGWGWGTSEGSPGRGAVLLRRARPGRGEINDVSGSGGVPCIKSKAELEVVLPRSFYFSKGRKCIPHFKLGKQISSAGDGAFK